MLDLSASVRSKDALQITNGSIELHAEISAKILQYVESNKKAAALGLVNSYCPHSPKELLACEFREDYREAIQLEDYATLKRYLREH